VIGLAPAEKSRPDDGASDGNNYRHGWDDPPDPPTTDGPDDAEWQAAFDPNSSAAWPRALAERMRDDRKTFTERDTEDWGQPGRAVETRVLLDGSLAVIPEGHCDAPVYVEFRSGRPVLVLFQDEHGDPESFRLYRQDEDD
jgi:hypothetical protein